MRCQPSVWLKAGWLKAGCRCHFLQQRSRVRWTYSGADASLRLRGPFPRHPLHLGELRSGHLGGELVTVFGLCIHPFISARIGSKYSAKRLGFSANGKCPMPCIAWNRTPGILAAVASDNSTVQE